MLNIDNVWLAETQQVNFRMLLDAMSRPGECYTMNRTSKKNNLHMSPEKSLPAFLAVLATLLDAEVTLADINQLLHSDEWPMLQAKPASAETADYIFCDGNRSPDFLPKLGTLLSPEQSATLVILVDEIGQGDTQLKLSGPGIAEITQLKINGLNNQWLTKRDEWVCSFPLGVDIIFVDSNQVVAIPRTTRLEIV